MRRSKESRIRAAAAVVLALAALAIAACGDDDDEGGSAATAPEGSFVGKVEGSNAYIAIVSDGEEVGGYLCNSADVYGWFQPSAIEDGRAELRSRDGELLGEVSLDADGATGEVDVGGDRLAFSTEPATGPAGLYREATGTPGEPGSTETGWIVLADGSFRGASSSGGVVTRAKRKPVSGIEETQTPDLAPVVTDP